MENDTLTGLEVTLYMMERDGHTIYNLDFAFASRRGRITGMSAKGKSTYEG